MVESEARFAIRSLASRAGSAVAPSHPWVSEADRWKEFVFALVAQVLPTPQPELRRAVDRMSTLGLLEVHSLAGLRTASKEGQLLDTRIRAILGKPEVDRETMDRAIGAIADAAQGLVRHHDGYVARYLRHYGELMLDEMGETFMFDTITTSEARDAMTVWLQNVLSMPLSLRDASVARFCKEHGLSLAEFITAADELEIDVAALDDMAQLEEQAVAPRPELVGSAR